MLFKNENIIALRNGKVAAMMPDLVCWMTDKGDPLTNADIRKGQRLIALGRPADKLVRTPKALLAFKHLYPEQGRKESFKPIEKL